MKRNLILLTIILISVALLISCNQNTESEFSELKGPYLGQKTPGSTPEIFTPGIISTKKDEINAVFSPDKKTFYFSRDTYSDLSKAGRDYTIYYMREIDGRWTLPNKVPFAGDYMNADMALSNDGYKLFFCSDRPITENQPRKSDADIWVVDVLKSGWSEPRVLGLNVNSDKHEWYPCLAENGTLYFSSSRMGGKGKSDLYYSKPVNGVYQNVKHLPGAVNTQFREGDVFIAPDESFLILVSSDRPDTYGKGDLYISFRDENGEWSKAVNMGNIINSSSHDFCPMLSPDGKYLFYTNSKRGNDDIYWVDAKIIEDFIPEELH